MSAHTERWFRQPIVWLGMAVFCASLAGCIGVIVLASRYEDEPLPVAGERVFKVPALQGADVAASQEQR